MRRKYVKTSSFNRRINDAPNWKKKKVIPQVIWSPDDNPKMIS